MNIRKTIVSIISFSIFIIPPLNLMGSSPQKVLEELQTEIIKVFEITKSAVVTISTKSSQSYKISKDAGILSFLSDNEEEKTICYKNVCSGLIYNDDGYIITKTGIFSENDEITVTLCNGSLFEPIFIGKDYETGLTVFKINADKICPPRLGNSDNVTAGSWITIIGNSMGVSPSVSVGLVNGILNDELLQLSATINPGNSGSPVFDIHGNAIGILIAKIGATGSVYNSNLFTEGGLAVPINKVRQIVDGIISSYQHKAGWLGVQLNPESTSNEKIVIMNVISNSPADRAGLKKGDILLQFNNISIQKAEQLGKLIENTKPGSTIPISFLRDNTRLNVFATISRRNAMNTKMAQAAKNFQTNISQNNYIQTSSYSDIEIRNEIKRLEHQLFQLKMLINKQVLK